MGIITELFVELFTNIILLLFKKKIHEKNEENKPEVPKTNIDTIDIRLSAIETKIDNIVEGQTKADKKEETKTYNIMGLVLDVDL